MNQELLMGFGALIIIICGILAYKSFRNRQSAKEEAEEFLKGLGDHLENVFLQIINDIDIRTFDNFEEYEKYALSLIYDRIWDYIEFQIQTYENKDLISTLARKILTKEYIDTFIHKLLEERAVEDKIMNKFGSEVLEQNSEDMIAEDNKLVNEFANQEEYNEEVDKNSYNYEAAEEEKHTQEEIDALNPQQDIHEEVFDDNDTSVEEINEYIQVIVNKAGKTMYYHVDEYGKKKQISKQKAEESGLEIKGLENDNSIIGRTM